MLIRLQIRCQELGQYKSMSYEENIYKSSKCCYDANCSVKITTHLEKKG